MFGSLRIALSAMDLGSRLKLAMLLLLGGIQFSLEAIIAITIYDLLSRLSGKPAEHVFSLFSFNQTTQPGHLLFIIAAGYAVKNLLRVIDLIIRGAVVEQVIMQLSDQLYRSLFSLSFLHSSSAHSSRLIHLTTHDVEVTFRQVLVFWLYIFHESLICSALVTTLLMTSPLEILQLSLLMSMIAVGIIWISKTRHQRWGEQVHTGTKTLMKQVQETLNSLREIQISGSQTYFEKEYSEQRNQTGRRLRYQGLLESFPGIILELLMIVLVIVVIGRQLKTGNSDQSVLPVLGIFCYAGLKILPSISKVLAYLSGIQTAVPVVKAIQKQLALVDVEQSKESDHPITFHESIQLQNVSFSYPERIEAGVSGISLEITKGSSLAIVGPSGAGKSTLLGILLGLIPADHGTILIDNFDLLNNEKAWQQKIGFVPQEPVLLAATIRSNIALGQTIIDEERLLHAIQVSQLNSWIETLPAGLETEVGEKGVLVSGGERQRLAIARAIYRNPEVMIMDEPTSAIDVQTEKELERSLLADSDELTRIIVTHRLETAKECDQVAFLKAGRLVAAGTFEELINSCPEFSDFVNQVSASNG